MGAYTIALLLHSFSCLYKGQLVLFYLWLSNRIKWLTEEIKQLNYILGNQMLLPKYLAKCAFYSKYSDGWHCAGLYFTSVLNFAHTSSQWVMSTKWSVNLLSTYCRIFETHCWLQTEMLLQRLLRRQRHDNCCHFLLGEMAQKMPRLEAEHLSNVT